MTRNQLKQGDMTGICIAQHSDLCANDMSLFDMALPLPSTPPPNFSFSPPARRVFRPFRPSLSRRHCRP